MKVMTLQDLPFGQMGEIVDLSEEHKHILQQGFGIGIGMTIMHLHKAMDGLVQIGYSQLHLDKQYLKHIKVRPVSV